MKKAVLFLTFNRLDVVQKSFEAFRRAKPPRFYVASDGARQGVEGEKEKVEQVRKWILDNIDWDCEVKTKFNETNFGCGKGVSSAITWFFENEEDGIILEDDCVANQSFFAFCEELLDKYKDDKRVWHIAGDNPMKIIDRKETYWFSKLELCWGWASWADRWKHFTLDVSNYDKNVFLKISNDEGIINYWDYILTELQNGKIDSWAYCWTFCILKNDGYCINPTKNLVSNIGNFGVHYENKLQDARLNLPTYPIDKIMHPKEMIYDKNACDLINTRVFGRIEIKKRTIGEILIYMWRHPFFLFTNKFYKFITEKNINFVTNKVTAKEIADITNIPIFLASDDNYAPFLCTTMFSILENTNSFCEFYVLDNNISETSKKLIEKSLDPFKNFSVEYIDISNIGLDKFPNLRHYSVNTFSRYFIPELKPNLKKVLYLDVDIIVKGDIKELFEQDLKGKALGAILEDFYQDNAVYLKNNIYPEFSSGIKYFNAGVLVMDLSKIKEQNLMKICIEKTIELADKLSTADQDVLNIVFENNYTTLDYRFNFMPDFDYKLRAFNPKDFKKTASTPLILHYVWHKPWKDSETKRRQDFLEVLACTEFEQLVKNKYPERNKIRTKKGYFLGLPLIKIKDYGHKTKIYFCNILIIKIKNI